MLQDLLQRPEWLQVQALWLNLQYFFDHDKPTPDWDFLSVWMDRQLNVLQRLVLQKQIGVSIQKELHSLFQRRFEQVLQRFHQQQPQPYGLHYHVPRGPFTRYQALGDLEQALQRCQRNLGLPQVPQSIRDHVLHDLNFEVIERYIRQQPADIRPLCWQPALEQVVWLSWAEKIDLSAFKGLEVDISFKQKQEWALRALKSSFQISVQCSAIRLLTREKNTALQQTYFLPLFEAKQTPEAILLEMLTGITVDNTWEWPLLILLKTTSSDIVRQRIVRYWSRLPNAEHREFLHQLLQTTAVSKSWSSTLKLLTWKALASTSSTTLPYEGLPEAFDSIVPLLQHAVGEHDTNHLEQVLDIFALLKDPRAVPVLLGVLNGTFRKDSLLEQMGGGFRGERQSETTYLRHTLERLGCTLYFDSTAEKWQLQ